MTTKSKNVIPLGTQVHSLEGNTQVRAVHVILFLPTNGAECFEGPHLCELVVLWAEMGEMMQSTVYDLCLHFKWWLVYVAVLAYLGSVAASSLHKWV